MQFQPAVLSPDIKRTNKNIMTNYKMKYSPMIAAFGKLPSSVASDLV